MHARIHIEYGADAVIKALDDDRRTMLREAFPGLDLPPVPEPLTGWSIGWDKREQTIDLATTGAVLVELGVDFKVKRFHSCYRVAESGTSKTVNIQVAIPNLLLWSVDEVQVMEDACTDDLQRHLDDGWRVLAICPPAAQRRPDYVIGRQRDARKD